jgi:hypothetical protein
MLTQNAQSVSLARGAANLVIANMLAPFANLPAFLQAGLGVAALA